MKATATLVAAAGLATSASAQYFSAIAARSASPIHLQEINANGGAFWIGKSSTHYCPDTVRSKGGCPDTDYTNFAIGEHGALALGAAVPGGQQVYVDATSGALGFTVPHSGAEPAGAIADGWTLEQGQSTGSLSWKGGLLACSEKKDVGPWQIYGVLAGVTPCGECLGMDVLTSNGTKPAAWEYV